MNHILANTCPKYKMEDGTSVFRYDLCCEEIEIEAKLLGIFKNGDHLEYKYEIIGYKFI